MWKWVALAALIYGMLAITAGISPRRAALGRMLDLAAVSDTWELPASMPAAYDFESPSPPPITRPPAHVEVVTQESNHVLRWIPPVESPLAVLGLPFSPPEAGAAIELRLRTQQLPAEAMLTVGVHERDGSLYVVRQQPGPEWQRLTIQWESLALAPTSSDENKALDAAQIDAVFIAVHVPGELADRARERWREQRPPPPAERPKPLAPQMVIEIDDVAFSAEPER
jgi:hypothetical protein